MSAWDDENRWYARLMKLAHELAMEGRGEEAQDLRVAATHARNYRWLRDHSSPESCLYYLCSDRTQARFNDPSCVDRQIATDIANNEARTRLHAWANISRIQSEKETYDMETFQQPKVTGYRQLNEQEAAAMNEIKQKGVEIGELVEKLRVTAGLDQRWISIGATDLQKGLMALVRGVAQPTTF